MGNRAVIRQGDIQVMSAGTGVFHSEYNPNSDQAVNFLQIWIFPNKKDMEPRYDQLSIGDIAQANELIQILSPDKEDQGVWIHQNAWFHIGNFAAGKSTSYSLNREDSGVYIFLLEGELEVEGQLMEKRDGMGIQGKSEISFTPTKSSSVLLMEVPMSY
jgi:redox-sensitive bicupin YhaK (pirin superfamily)